MAAAKARTPLLGPSGPACAMEMSYCIHRGHKGNPLPGPGVPCPLPVPPWHRAVPHACPPLLPLPAHLCPTTPPWSWGVPVPCHHGLGGCPGTGRVPRGWPAAAGPHIFCTASRAQASSPSASWITPLAPPTWPGTHRGTVARLRDTSVSCWGRGHSGSRCAQGHRDQPGWLLVGQCQRCQAPRGSLPPRCPQVELLGLVDLQDSAGAAVDNVTLVQCHPTAVPPGAAGMARGAWAGMVATGGRGPCPQRWMLLAWELAGDCHPVPSPGTGLWCRSPGARAERASCPRASAWGELGKWGRGTEGKGQFGDLFAFGVPYLHSLATVTSLSGQSCPATLRGACVAGTKISPVTSNGSAARGRGRAPTTPLAQVRGWLLSRGPRAAQGTPQPPVPRAGMCPAHPKQPHACGESSAGTALRHLDLGWGCRWCRRSSEHPCPCPLCPGCPQHSGYFLAADPSAPWSRGQRAQLVTYRQESTTAPRCLSFWYRLAGPQIGTQPHGVLPGMPQLGSTPLETAGSPRGAGQLPNAPLCPGTLNLKLRLEGAEEKVLWTQRGTQGSIWHRGRATLPATGQRQYQVTAGSPPCPWVTAGHVAL